MRRTRRRIPACSELKKGKGEEEKKGRWTASFFSLLTLSNVLSLFLSLSLSASGSHQQQAPYCGRSAGATHACIHASY